MSNKIEGMSLTRGTILVRVSYDHTDTQPVLISAFQGGSIKLSTKQLQDLRELLKGLP